MCALVIYDAWLTQQALREDGMQPLPDWDWDALAALLMPRTGD